MTQRPRIITIICIMGFIGAPITLLTALRLLELMPDHWFPALLMLSGVLGFVSMIGLWRMRRWGLIMYALLSVLSQAALISLEAWSPGAALAPLVIVCIGLAHHSEMD